MYCLILDTGDLFPPKDNNDRRELALSEHLIKETRQAALVNAMQLAGQGHTFSQTGGGRWATTPRPARWRRVSMDALQLQTAAPNAEGKLRRKRAPTSATWEKDIIIEERRRGCGREFLVQWMGYEPSWEVWREEDWNGNVGDPVQTEVQTWEPLKTLRSTSALEAWEVQRAKRKHRNRRSAQKRAAATL